MNTTPPESASKTASVLLLTASTGRSAAVVSAIREQLDSELPPAGCLVLWLACSAVTGVAADKESTDGLTAQQILDKMATTYATCKSYRDSGCRHQ